MPYSSLCCNNRSKKPPIITGSSQSAREYVKRRANLTCISGFRLRNEVTQLAPTVLGVLVKSLSASKILAISPSIRGLGGTPRRSKEKIQLRSTLSSVGVNLRRAMPASLAGIVPLRRLCKVDLETSYRRAVLRKSLVF